MMHSNPWKLFRLNIRSYDDTRTAGPQISGGTGFPCFRSATVPPPLGLIRFDEKPSAGKNLFCRRPPISYCLLPFDLLLRFLAHSRIQPDAAARAFIGNNFLSSQGSLPQKHKDFKKSTTYYAFFKNIFNAFSE